MVSFVTAVDLRAALSYDPETGVFTWLASPRRSRVAVGQVAGCRHHTGYVFIKFCGKTHLAHRLAWLHVYGEWPAGDLDHINLDKADNRLCNLRPSDDSRNQANTRLSPRNTSGRKGVCWAAASGKWQASIRYGGRQQYLGQFDALEDAAAAYEAAALQHFGEYARLN